MGTFVNTRRTSNDPPAGAQGFTLGAYTSAANTGSCVAGESEFRGSALCWHGHTGSGQESTWWSWGKIFGVTKVTPGEWHHYAVARSSGTIYVFLDGGLEAMKTVTSGECETDYEYPGLELAIGGTPDGDPCSHGSNPAGVYLLLSLNVTACDPTADPHSSATPVHSSIASGSSVDRSKTSPSQGRAPPRMDL